ncbi:SAM-dependent methyltransferase [Westiellopsis prolifica IICB1]|nr:SAM-dependent methyltransferase [Westiellopsis prolifica IICB1]
MKDLVSLSSRMMAAVRAIETQRPDGLFKDPLAAILAGDDIIAEIAPSAQQYEDQGTPVVAVRTRFFDDFLMSQVDQIRQVVILGAGMDTRAFRLPWQRDTHLYELDRKEVLQYKESVLGNIQSRCTRHSIEVDIKESWADKLIGSGYLPEIPSVWVMEGFVYYLSETQVHELLKTITKLSAPGSWFLADLINSFFVSKSTDELSKHWKYGCDEPENLLSTYNWEASVLQAGDEGANFGRFTHKFQPRNVLDAPHYFFVKAVLKMEMGNSEI